MSDRRVTPPRLMSRAELADHMSRYHGHDGHVSLASHNRLHHFQKANHAHRSALLSEQDHPDWAVR